MEYTDCGKVQVATGTLKAIMDYTDGRREEFDLGHNIIVNVASDLMAELMRGMLVGPRAQVDGLRTLAVGTGAVGWDLQNPPAETAAQTQLENELYRKEFDTVNYIDGTGAVTATRTNVIDLTTVFDTSEANGALVEMGLFGGTDSLMTTFGTMLNYFTMPVINKDNSASLTIVWRISF